MWHSRSARRESRFHWEQVASLPQDTSTVLSIALLLVSPVDNHWDHLRRIDEVPREYFQLTWRSRKSIRLEQFCLKKWLTCFFTVHWSAPERRELTENIIDKIEEMNWTAVCFSLLKTCEYSIYYRSWLIECEAPMADMMIGSDLYADRCVSRKFSSVNLSRKIVFRRPSSTDCV